MTTSRKRTSRRRRTSRELSVCEVPPLTLAEILDNPLSDFLEPEEFDLKWLPLEVPWTWFRWKPSFPGQVVNDSARRIEDILRWMADFPTPRAALQSSPVLALGNGKIIDGWHRLAALRHIGATAVPVPTIVGLTPSHLRKLQREECR
jgi:hypothetical protein